MKLYKYVALCCILIFSNLTAQEKISTSKGKVIGKVFFNYHMNTSDDMQQKSAFELTRAYLGYKYKINDRFSATIILDAGKAIGGSDHSVFVKNAKLEYKAENWLTFAFGIFGMKQFKDQ